MRLTAYFGYPVLAGLLALAAMPAGGIEIASGSMLGPRYRADYFYVRSGASSAWYPTYSGRRFRGKVRGSLALLRVTQAIFDDEWLTEQSYDPQANTDRLIAKLDVYKQHGVAGIVVGLQGGDPRYAGELNGVRRGVSADLGETAGALVSAYDPDGSLKPEWAIRLDRLLTAADRRGLIVVLVLFQQDQDEVLESPEAIVVATRNVARHLIARNARNVIIDVADAWDETEGRWDHRRFIPRNIELLIRSARGQFQQAAFSLPLGASSGSGMLYPMSLARLCDVVLLQGDGRTPADKLARSRQFKQYRRPVLMVSDSSGGAATNAELARERSIAQVYLEGAAGWSFVPALTANRFPFEYELADSARIEDSWPARARYRAYFRAMLEGIAKIVLRSPPSSSGKGKQ